MDTDVIKASLETAQTAITTALHQWDTPPIVPPPVIEPTPAPVPAPQPPPPPVPAPLTGLQRMQRWVGAQAVGVYLGIETVDWSMNDFANRANQFRDMGVDVAYVKVGEYGTEWYNGNFAAIRQIFLDRGVGCAPYLFCRPETWRGDLAIAVKMARLTGGVVLDCEEQFVNQGASLYNIVNGTRRSAPDACIIVSGYGDPLYAFGPKWPFDAIRDADAYQPQWYFGVWDAYKQHGYLGAIAWGDGQCADEFRRCGLGDMFAIQPAVNVEGMDQADYQGIAETLRRFTAGIVIWEAQQINANIIQQCRHGMGR